MDELSLHLLDLIQNSIRAKATEIIINIKVVANECIVSVLDNGIGFDKKKLKEITSPFYTTKKTKVAGLGLSLIKQLTQNCNGCFCIDRIDCKTIIHFSYSLTCIDRPIFGKIEDTIITTIKSNPELDLVLTLEYENSYKYNFSTKLVKKELQINKIESKEVIDFLYQDLKEGLKKLKEVDFNEFSSIKETKRKT